MCWIEGWSNEEIKLLLKCWFSGLTALPKKLRGNFYLICRRSFSHESLRIRVLLRGELDAWNTSIKNKRQ